MGKEKLVRVRSSSRMRYGLELCIIRRFSKKKKKFDYSEKRRKKEKKGRNILLLNDKWKQSDKISLGNRSLGGKTVLFPFYKL